MDAVLEADGAHIELKFSSSIPNRGHLMFYVYLEKEVVQTYFLVLLNMWIEQFLIIIRRCLEDKYIKS